MMLEGIAVGGGDDCGFCGRKIKVPLVRERGLAFCCTSCFRAYRALHTLPSTVKETEKPKKAAKKRKAKKHVNRKPKRGR